MIEILVNENPAGTGSDQSENTTVAKSPNNMRPEWKETLTLDIIKPTDEIAIQIINNYNGVKDILAEKRF